jgi:hypothetical protein
MRAFDATDKPLPMSPSRPPSDRLSRWLAALLAAAALAAAARAELPDPVRFGAAIEAGDIRAARAWLDEGLDPNFVGDRIGTGLMIAAWEGNLEMMELFVSRGADVNGANDSHEQALLFAAWRGRLEAVRWLLDRGAQINRRGLEWSALHYATFAGHEDVVRVLLERGADVNARSTNGSSPLMMAAREGRERVAGILLERGADPATMNDRGEDALSWAMRHDNPRIARMVASPERFAAAARSGREAFGPAVRSVPVPERIDALFREMRAAELEGRLTDELRNAYFAAVSALEKPPPAAEAVHREPPKALEITARREAPGEESAVLMYERGPSEPITRSAPEAQPVKPVKSVKSVKSTKPKAKKPVTAQP